MKRRTIKELPRTSPAAKISFTSDDEMSALFSDIPEALENNFNLPYRCNFRPQFSKPVLPNISTEKGGSADEILKKNSLDGLKEKFIKVFNSQSNGIYPKEGIVEYFGVFKKARVFINHILQVLKSRF